jgi:ssDNA-binding Zn-finger/Zn-ribbon topoisomerase 1
MLIEYNKKTEINCEKKNKNTLKKESRKGGTTLGCQCNDKFRIGQNIQSKHNAM